MPEDANIFNGYNSIFSFRLKELMELESVTQNELASYIGCSRQAVAKYMDGSAIPSAKKLACITRFFNVSCDYLLGFTDVMSPKMEVRAISNYTGLAESVIRVFHSFTEKKDDVLFFFNYLTRNSVLIDVAINFHNYMMIILDEIKHGQEANAEEQLDTYRDLVEHIHRKNKKDIVLFACQNEIYEGIIKSAEQMLSDDEKTLNELYKAYDYYNNNNHNKEGNEDANDSETMQ